MKILADASLPLLEQAFPKPFKITLYHQAEDIPALLTNHDILFCRSTLKVNKELFKSHLPRYLATASSGTDHLDKHYLETNGVTIFDAKGSNAPAVADYVLSTIAYLQKNTPFTGQKAGIIGLGHVGSLVKFRLKILGFEVISYDPLKNHHDPSFLSCALEELFSCDLLCIHANLHDTQLYPSRNLLDNQFLKQLKPNSIVINTSRGGIVNEAALLRQTNPIIYCTDVYSNEPDINPELIAFSTLCTPHIAGHSLEAKYNAVKMITDKIHQVFHLSSPSLKFQKPSKLPKLEYLSWREAVLSLYNPLEETMLLKQASNKKEAFQMLRKHHQHRHDFSIYQDQITNKLLLNML